MLPCAAGADVKSSNQWMEKVNKNSMAGSARIMVMRCKYRCLCWTGVLTLGVTLRLPFLFSSLSGIRALFFPW